METLRWLKGPTLEEQKESLMKLLETEESTSLLTLLSMIENKIWKRNWHTILNNSKLLEAKMRNDQY